jgi:hypothetical protein
VVIDHLVSEVDNFVKLRAGLVSNSFDFPVGDDLKVSDSGSDELPLKLEGLELSLVNDGVADNLVDLVVEILVEVISLLVGIEEGLKELLVHLLGVFFSVLDGTEVNSILADLVSSVDSSVSGHGVARADPLVAGLNPARMDSLPFVLLGLVIEANLGS